MIFLCVTKDKEKIYTHRKIEIILWVFIKLTGKTIHAREKHNYSTGFVLHIH